jgi:hypothetical protein
MTMHSSDQRQGGFFHSTLGETIITIVITAAVILLAWRYVF